MTRIKYMLMCSLMVLLAACEKDTEPVNFAPRLTTGNVTDIYRKGATLSGSIHFSGTSTAQSYGILFSELQSMAEFTEYPVKDDSLDFSVDMQNLTPNTTYYYCAYANSGFSLAKGEVKSFTTTESNAPVFAEVTLEEKDATSCVVSATIIDEGGSDLILTGFCWANLGDGEPTIDDNVRNVSVEGNVLTAHITGLKPETEYQIRAYGVNASGIGYSDVCSFATEAAEVAYLCQGSVFNEHIKLLANNKTMTKFDTDSIVKRIEFKTGINGHLSGNYIEVSAEDSPTPIYASFNNIDGLLSIYTLADCIEIVDASFLFDNLKALSTIDFGNFGITGATTNIEMMFGGCLSLQSVDCSMWDTSNVTNMDGVFYNCETLTSLDVANWNTANVTDMGFLFSGCSALTSLDVSSWNTSNVTDMGDLFQVCSSLTSLDVSNWDTSNVTNMYSMFNLCHSLASLDVSGWDTSNVTDMHAIFQSCGSLTTVDVSNWNTSNVTDMSQAFAFCSALSSLDVSGWDTSNVTNMSFMFRECEVLSSLDVKNWNTAKVTNMNAVFMGCYVLSSLDVSKWNTSNVKVMSSMFGWCHKLSSLNMSEWNMSNVTSVNDMFIQCTEMTSLNLANWDVSNVNNLDRLFRDCFSLTELNLSSWKLNEDMTCLEMFTNCALISKSCEITASQATQETLTKLTESTGMESSNFTWVTGE